ncbi:MAG TPA: branched-chain amino acid ABC transporter permease, partial [Azospira sp.]|nr:branched-chain amino acid ABC transporter permease [Azospira sp.]
MDILLQQIINGLVQGAIYAMVALGYTMVYGIMGLINFAHGEVVMIGTLVAITVVTLLIKAGLPVMLAGACGIVAAAVACMALGWALERVAYRPLRNAPRLTPLITAIGCSIVLQNVAMMVWGRNYMTFPSLIEKTQFEIAGASFTSVQVMIVLVAAISMGGLLFLVYRTKLGMAMRATAQNPAVAGLMGVNANRVISSAFVIGSALGAVAGVMVGT